MLKVAVGVIKNKAGEILISRRAETVHQGGLWEFPGGKFEQSESSFQALKRELKEELGIEIDSATPLIKIPHQYKEKLVLLDVMLVGGFSGQASGLEGQPVKWVAQDELKQYQFPEANKAILKALSLPKFYPIVDASLGNRQCLLEHLQALIAMGHKLIQLRAKNLSKTDFIELAEKAISMSKSRAVRLFINTSLEMALNLNAEGVHISGEHFKKLDKELLKESAIKVAVSCHTKADLECANILNVEFAVLSPVCKTQSHPTAKPLGWERFAELLSVAQLPVYALGGLTAKEIDVARASGAQGIAGIRGFKA